MCSYGFLDFTRDTEIKQLKKTISTHVTEFKIQKNLIFGIQNPQWWNPESRFDLESESKQFRMQNPEGWNLESRGLESGIQRIRIRNLKAVTIQNPCGSEQLYESNNRSYNFFTIFLKQIRI